MPQKLCQFFIPKQKLTGCQVDYNFLLIEFRLLVTIATQLATFYSLARESSLIFRCYFWRLRESCRSYPSSPSQIFLKDQETRLCSMA